MASSDVIIFYDILRNEPDLNRRPTSGNCWKARLALNIKGIPYKTVWLEFPDIEAESKKVGATPTGERGGKPLYTVPFIYDPATRTAVSDSQEIVKYLERQYPDAQTLFPPRTRALQAAFIGSEQTIMSRIFGPARPLCISRLLDTATEAGRVFFRQIFGSLLENLLVMSQEEKEAQAEGTLKVLDEINGWMNAEEGVFLTGAVPSNADVWVASTLIAFRNILGKEDAFWKRIESANEGRWKKYMAAFDDQNWFAVL